MLIPKEDRKKIHEYLFREGKRHPQIPNIAKKSPCLPKPRN